MKLKEGMYVRYEGMINKIIEIDDEYLVFENNWFDHWADEVSSMKIDRFINDYKPRYSFDLIDLAEENDLITLKSQWCKDEIYKVINKGNKQIQLDMYDNGILIIRKTENIESILPHEQYERNSYKVVE